LNLQKKKLTCRLKSAGKRALISYWEPMNDKFSRLLVAWCTPKRL